MTSDLAPTAGPLEPYQAPAAPALKAGPLDYPTVLALGKAFAASGLFPGVKDEGVAAVKILAGAEMGLEPVAAMNGIDIIAMPNRPPRMRPNADVQALLAARAGYTFKPSEHTEQRCLLEWFRNGEYLGTSEFSVAQAQKARLVRDGGAWQAWPMNMTLARAITQGIKLYCRHILAGNIGGMAIVTSDELDQEYPDPRSDEIRALHATYREAFPNADKMDPEDYRAARLFWSADILGRDVVSWNGPEAPETLTLTDVRQLLDEATSVAVSALSGRLRERFGDDEIAGLNFLRRILPDVPFDQLSDLTGKQRQVVHKALDSLHDEASQISAGEAELHSGVAPAAKAPAPAEHHTQPALSGQAAPVSPGVPSAMGAESSEALIEREGAEDEGEARVTDAPVPSARQSEPAGGNAMTQNVTGTAAASGEVRSAPSGRTSAPSRVKRPGKPNLREAQQEATRTREQSTAWNAPANWTWTFGIKERSELLRLFGSSPANVHVFVQRFVDEDPDIPPLSEWATREWYPTKLEVLMETARAEKGAGQ